MTIKELTDLLNRTLNFDFVETKEGCILAYDSASFEKDGKEVVYTITAGDVSTLLDCDDVLMSNPLCIKSKRYSEFLLRDTSQMPSRLRKNSSFRDDVNSLSYELGEPSLRMFMAILKYAEEGHDEIVQETLRNSRMFSRYYRDDLDGINILKSILSVSRYISLKITLDEEATYDKFDFNALCDSFCFNKAYNTSVTILPIDKLEDVYETKVTRKVSRSRTEDMEPPRKKYNSELVQFYLRAVSGESRDYQYLSYYHILEYFFENVYQESVIKKIRADLTHPGFSYKRDRDIKSFYKDIKKLIRSESSASEINEQESLKLTLLRYLPDMNRVKDSLETVSAGVVEYYKTETGPFSKNAVNFDLGTDDTVYANLANRIYAIRNAIAHSKDSSSKDKFIPYKHDSLLKNEVLLIRIIAEEVIVNSAKEL